MNWNTGEEDGSGWAGLAPSRDPEEKAFNDGVRSVISIRCMEHREIPEINLSTGHSECGECIRQQCYKDMMGLLRMALSHSRGKERSPLLALIDTLERGQKNGIGTFGVPDEREKEFAARVQVVAAMQTVGRDPEH